jgi:hypothetical protein
MIRLPICSVPYYRPIARRPQASIGGNHCNAERSGCSLVEGAWGIERPHANVDQEEVTLHAARRPRSRPDRSHLCGAGSHRDGRECEAAGERAGERRPVRLRHGLADHLRGAAARMAAHRLARALRPTGRAHDEERRRPGIPVHGRPRKGSDRAVRDSRSAQGGRHDLPVRVPSERRAHWLLPHGVEECLQGRRLSRGLGP